jgi:hypothetical protein
MAGTRLAVIMTNEHEGNIDDRDLLLALRRLDNAVVVPAADPAREAALMAAFDAAQRRRAGIPKGRQYWFMAGLATAASALLAVSSSLPRAQAVPQPPNEFVMVPGAAMLPAMESGSLVRMDIPVAELAALGLAPPPSNRTGSVKADLVVAQDGLPRAVRLVN